MSRKNPGNTGRKIIKVADFALCHPACVRMRKYEAGQDKEKCHAKKAIVENIPINFGYELAGIIIKEKMQMVQENDKRGKKS